jgi:hypothetical protein
MGLNWSLDLFGEKKKEKWIGKVCRPSFCGFSGKGLTFDK